MTFRGRVVGPTFAFEEKEVDFGLVSYGFLNQRTLNLVNTSAIPMKFYLRIPQVNPILLTRSTKLTLVNRTEATLSVNLKWCPKPAP